MIYHNYLKELEDHILDDYCGLFSYIGNGLLLR